MVYNGTITWFTRNKKYNGKTQECQVKILGRDIRVECLPGDFDEVIWEGTEEQEGHYKLTSEGGSMATLHRFGDDRFLEGHVNEREASGDWMWEISPKNPVVAEQPE